MLSQPGLPNIAHPNKANNSESQSQQQQNVKLMRLIHDPLAMVKHVDDNKTAGPEFTVTQKTNPVDCVVILEENIRMRNAINDAVLTLSQWMSQPKDQNDNVNLLVNKMKDSLRNSQPDDVAKAMAIQMQARESQWAAERLAFQEKERVSKQMIFNLQQDNYRLRKSRIFGLTPRGPGAD